MQRYHLINILILIASLVLVSPSRGDLIYLQNGKTVEGEITETSPGLFLIKGKGGSFTVRKEMIIRIIRRDEVEETSSVNLVIELGAMIKKDDADKLKTAVVALGIPESMVTIFDDPPYYKVRVGPYRKEAEAIAVTQKLDTAQLPNVYHSGSKLFQINSESTTATATVSALAGEANIALAVNGAKVIADSEQSGYSAQNAIDGNTLDPGSRWISDSSAAPHWLEVEFGRVKPFTRIELYTGESHSIDYILRNFSFQYWNGSEWKDIPGAGKKNNLVENPKFTFSELSAQKVRLYIQQGSNVDNVARIYELKIFGPESSQYRSDFNRASLVERAYQIQLTQSTLGDSANPTISTHTAEWYTLSCSVHYQAQDQAVLSASILPDANDFWTDAELRKQLGLTPDDYNISLHFDTQRTPGYNNVIGTNDLSFTIKSKSPTRSGTYKKTLRIELLNPETRNSYIFQEIPFNLKVE
jgi:hypothetical protein